ncbi:hypothetical protein [Mesonia mobilis]|uniref:UVR domain-containing protein n=1 Tax=Mesonia mobilis TaxID=369791 RepID=A0ABQ3C627_9FLAO|nr:hypothetical protein [Mesonia mobilis]MBQ0739680.1 hypothetical protein [Aquimarina celericrescens]GGZ65330.1 hypothetical protein GCM10008088_28330 [Mesonia mobilis]
MDIKFPKRDNLNQNKENFKNKFNEQLELLVKIKEDLIEMKRYEEASVYRDMEVKFKEWKTHINRK